MRSVVVYKRGAEVAGMTSIMPFDVRLVGFMSFAEMERDTKFSDFDTHRFLSNGGAIDREGSLTSLVSLHDNGRLRRTLYLDEDRNLALTCSTSSRYGAEISGLAWSCTFSAMR